MTDDQEHDQEQTGRARPARRAAPRRGEREDAPATRTRRTASRKTASKGASDGGSGGSDGSDGSDGPGGPDGPGEAGRNGRALPAEAARRAAEQIVSLTGRELESVVSIERRDEGWSIGVEVVETRRIPDSADILAVFEVDVDENGDLHGYRRTGRYSRGQMHRGGR
ncbi:gas vesicle protein GvpO [Pseudonocardia sp. NPDC049154]|uniref:gas vesicle protein GvpO n=1 Tax=Pseudonocardia sp. NPDC049154 TaxID=3155501 RepID=UPI0033C93AAA